MYDLTIRNGTVVDGTGSTPRLADVAIADGKIAAVEPRITAASARTIDAEGRVVTPGFVDCHTHYDGQATWDPVLEPSASHGVTTVVMGNCGVGFAPVRPGSEEWLVQLMEGVEDIPGAALTEGIEWQWESFPEYLDCLGSRSYSMDVGAQIAHGAVRGYVMGDRGARNEPADPEDIAQMREIVREALEAGAMGVSTSRTIAHRAIDGEPVPGTYAAEDELFGLGDALRDTGVGIFELAPNGVMGEDLAAPHKEIDWMCRLSAATGRPVSFALVQVDAAPDLYKEILEISEQANREGAQVYPQIANRPTGVLLGLQTSHAFVGRPSYDALAHLPLPERVARMSDPEVKAAILRETVDFDNQFAEYMGTQLHRIFVLGNPPDYEPGPERSVAYLAEAEGVDIQSKLYDLLLEDEGKALLMFPIVNYSNGDLDAVRSMLLHPAGVFGLSDGGAHCGSICDASMTTWALTHWTRDRSRGERLPLELIVKKQTHDTARLFGMADRGTLAVGQRADVNVIDYENLRLQPPELVTDLPGDSRRLLQGAKGYDYTICSGEVTREHDEDTGARPGRLVRASK